MYFFTFISRLQFCYLIRKVLLTTRVQWKSVLPSLLSAPCLALYRCIISTLTSRRTIFNTCRCACSSTLEFLYFIASLNPSVVTCSISCCFTLDLRYVLSCWCITLYQSLPGKVCHYLHWTIICSWKFEITMGLIFYLKLIMYSFHMILLFYFIFGVYIIIVF